MPHIQVADVAASVERALALGGSMLMDAKADDGTSQWSQQSIPSPIPIPIALLGQERRQGSTVRARAVHQRRAARDQRQRPGRRGLLQQ
jgi:hypothetical protein